ncbi:hypothetical protein [Psychrobacter sp. PP-21]|uniref:hypothetical protein n=1 Tax=Psychrobacter sp. PP-21 TaxID=2957503 RepID=UPI0029C0BACF|nr:hypothetical protein [Psychrobacter sp. PP-21]
MFKSYYQQHSLLSSDEIYEGLLSYGMFSDNLPSFLQSVDFFAWCKVQKQDTFQKTETTPVYYESIRNINIPRIITIPNPIAYRNLCFNLKNNWNDILLHFQTYTGVTLPNLRHLINRIKLPD